MEFTATNEGFLVPEERPMLSRGKHHYAFSTANSSPSKRFTVLEERSFFRCSEEAQDEADRKQLVEEPVTVEKEHMFDKVVTPSDVGKLNRLVIPKQYAERYFPLDSPGNEKGFLLNFEDRNGKPWRFRYSYWSSSQSYVITKGWSRFVKEKRLNAGDIVSFLRGVGESKKHQLFIDWKHRRSNHVDPNSRQEQPFVPLMNMNPGLVSVPHHQQFLFRGSVSSWAYPNLPRVSSGSMINSYGYGDGPMMKKPMIMESVPVVQVKKTKKKAELKKLRLFGVNMECPNTDSDECITKIQPPYLHHHSRLGQVLDMEKANWLELN